MAKEKTSEADLAKHFINYFSDAYEIYQEVPCYGIIDFVAMGCGVKIGVEVKQTLNFKVIEQAVNNIPYLNYSYIAVPSAKGPERNFAYKICKSFGVGVLEYYPDSMYRIYGIKNPCLVKEVLKPSLNRKPSRPLELKEWMKRSIAGSVNDRMTQFKYTIETISRKLSDNRGKMLLKEVLKDDKYHWHTITSARSCIKTWCYSGVIKEFRFEDGYLILNDKI